MKISSGLRNTDPHTQIELQDTFKGPGNAAQRHLLMVSTHGTEIFTYVAEWGTDIQVTGNSSGIAA
jgi:hypothetical protein